MTTGYLIKKTDHAYFLTLGIVDWVDLFSRKIYRDIIIDSFVYCRAHKGLKIWAFVIMTNHIHCILSATNNNLSDVLRDFKRHTASKILQTVNKPVESRCDWMLKRFEFSATSNIRNNKYQIWKHENHAETLLTHNFTMQKLNYIHLNPVRAGFVEKPEDWLYSSARNYLFQPGLMEIDRMDV